MAGAGPPARVRRHRIRSMGPNMARRSWPVAAGSVPLVERGGGRTKRGEARRRIDEVVVVLVLAPEVLSPESEAGVPCDPPSGLGSSGRMPGSALVDLGVEHRAGELRVVGPGTAVEVVGADLEPDVVDDT